MASSALVPGALPVAIEGHAYLCEPDYERTTVQVIRQQSDQSTEPGEQSLTPLGLWRRSQESWHHGAGQDFLDGRDEQAADIHRFRTSKGIDIWTRGQISLLPPTLKVFDSAGIAGQKLRLATLTHYTSGVPYLMLSTGVKLYYNAIPFGLFDISTQIGVGWTPTNASVTASTANPGWFTATATASDIVTIVSPTGTSGVPVDPGRSYSVLVGSKNISGSGAKILQGRIDWYDSSGTLISSTAYETASGADSPSATINNFFTAPGTAAYASVTATWTVAWTIGDVHDVVASIGPHDDIGTLTGPDIWNPVDIDAGDPTQTIQSIASDGIYLWAALGISGLHRWQSGGAAVADVPAAPGSGQISLVGYANGFLLAAGSITSTTGQNTLWTVDDPLGTPSLSVIKTHQNSSFVWEGIGPGRNCVYAWGNVGGNGEVYKITFDANTGTLSPAASFATYLPDGETIHSLAFYAGGVILGTGKGLRLGQADGAGNIDYGPLIPTDWPVRCIEPQDRYCWFGWTKYDSSTSGLGRVDLGYFTDTLTPAYASDLMTSDTSSGDVDAVVTFSPWGYQAAQRPPIRVFVVDGEGVYVQDVESRITSGTLSTGTVRYSTSEPKTARYVDIRHHALPSGGSVAVELQADDNGTWTSLGSSSTASSYGPSSSISAGDVALESLELRLTLNRPDPSGTDYSNSPELTRWTAKVLPTPSTIDETFTLNLHMKSTVETTGADGQPYHMDVPTEISYIKGLERTRTLVNLQIGSESHTVYVVGSQFKATHWHSPKREYAEGMMAVQFQTARG